MSDYQLKAVVQIAGGLGVLIREFTFAPGEATHWHRHSQMTDRCYGLEGLVTLERRDQPALEIGPGEVCEAAVGEVHRLVNHGPADARVLLVQTGGRYDFLQDDD